MPCTTKHILLECKGFNDTRKHYFHANTMKDLFENIHMDDVVLERDRVVPENIDFVTILKTQQTNQQKANYCWIEIPLCLC